MKEPRKILLGSPEYLPYAKSELRKLIPQANSTGGFASWRKTMSDGTLILIDIVNHEQTIIIQGAPDLVGLGNVSTDNTVYQNTGRWAGGKFTHKPIKSFAYAPAYTDSGIDIKWSQYYAGNNMHFTFGAECPWRAPGSRSVNPPTSRNDAAGITIRHAGRVNPDVRLEFPCGFSHVADDIGLYVRATSFSMGIKSVNPTTNDYSIGVIASAFMANNVDKTTVCYTGLVNQGDWSAKGTISTAGFQDLAPLHVGVLGKGVAQYVARFKKLDINHNDHGTAHETASPPDPVIVHTGDYGATWQIADAAFLHSNNTLNPETDFGYSCLAEGIKERVPQFVYVGNNTVFLMFYGVYKVGGSYNSSSAGNPFSQTGTPGETYYLNILMKSTDGGLNFDEVSWPVFDGALYGVGSLSTPIMAEVKNCFGLGCFYVTYEDIAAGTNNVLYTTDFGATWISKVIPAGISPYYSVLEPYDATNPLAIKQPIFGAMKESSTIPLTFEYYITKDLFTTWKRTSKLSSTNIYSPQSQATPLSVIHIGTKQKPASLMPGFPKKLETV